MRPNNHSREGLRVKKRDCVSKTKDPSVRPLSRARERVGERAARCLFGMAKPRSSRLALALFYPQRKPD